MPRKPPQKGYVPWDKGTFDCLVGGTPEPLESRFYVTFGILINLLAGRRTERGGGYRGLVELIARSHESEKKKREHRRRRRHVFPHAAPGGHHLGRHDRGGARAGGRDQR